MSEHDLNLIYRTTLYVLLMDPGTKESLPQVWGVNPSYEVIILRTRWRTELFIKCNEIVMMFVN